MVKIKNGLFLINIKTNQIKVRNQAISMELLKINKS